MYFIFKTDELSLSYILIVYNGKTYFKTSFVKKENTSTL